MNVSTQKPAGAYTRIAKRRALSFIIPGLLGTVFCTLPWFLNDDPVWLKCCITLCGALAIAVSVLGLTIGRTGLLLDRRGIWCGKYSMRRKLIPWDVVVGVRIVSWPHYTGEKTGILLALRDKAAYPGGKTLCSVFTKEVRQVLGNVDYSHPLLLWDDEWVWNINDIMHCITECMEHADVRDSLGTYKNANLYFG